MGTVLLVMNFLSVIVGIVSDLLRTNRGLIEDSLEHTKKLRVGVAAPASDGVIKAVTTGNVIMPSGSVNIGDETRISPMNAVVSNINDLLELPIRTGAGPPISIRDIGSVSDSTDIPTAYALVNGRRAVYIPVTKRPNASTLAVVGEAKANLGRFQALIPDDLKVVTDLDPPPKG